MRVGEIRGTLIAVGVRRAKGSAQLVAEALVEVYDGGNDPKLVGVPINRSELGELSGLVLRKVRVTFEVMPDREPGGSGE